MAFFRETLRLRESAVKLASGFGLTALALILGASAFAATGEVKGPVHISSKGVTDFGGDTGRFQAAMDADEREDAGRVELAVERTIIRSHEDATEHARITADEARAHARRSRDAAAEHARIAAAEARAHVRRAAYEARAHARRIAVEARARADVIAREARDAARAAAEEGRAAARDAAHEARRAAREAMEEARIEIARAVAMADEAVREARVHIVTVRERLDDTADGMDKGDWANAIEIRDGKIVRCNNPEKYPGTGCTPFTAEEKARIAAETRAAAERAAAAADRIEAEIREADQAIEE